MKEEVASEGTLEFLVWEQSKWSYRGGCKKLEDRTEQGGRREIGAGGIVRQSWVFKPVGLGARVFGFKTWPNFLPAL